MNRYQYSIRTPEGQEIANSGHTVYDSIIQAIWAGRTHKDKMPSDCIVVPLFVQELPTHQELCQQVKEYIFSIWPEAHNAPYASETRLDIACRGHRIRFEVGRSYILEIYTNQYDRRFSGHIRTLEDLKLLLELTGTKTPI